MIDDELVERMQSGDASAREELERRARYPFRDQWAQRSHYWKRSPECDALRALVKTVLLQPGENWTVQGFGMMRAYLPWGPNPKRFRLNVWNSDLAVPGVSVIHDHPWAFTSWIINGEFSNIRFVEDSYCGEDYDFMQIACGIEGDNSDAARQHNRSRSRLRMRAPEHYTTGDIYHQDADEIHLSGYGQGTVTLNDRIGDTEHARVFWPAGQEWVDAKPRKATYQEVSRTLSLATAKWQDEIVC